MYLGLKILPKLRNEQIPLTYEADMSIHRQVMSKRTLPPEYCMHCTHHNAGLHMCCRFPVNLYQDQEIRWLAQTCEFIFFVYIFGKLWQEISTCPPSRLRDVDLKDPVCWLISQWWDVRTVRTLLGSTDQEVLDITEQVYWGEYVLAPSKLPCLQQEECMMELQQQLSQCMVRVSLREGLASAGPTSQGQRCSYGHLSLWTWSPLAGPQRA